jgi:hypothetical protein
MAKNPQRSDFPSNIASNSKILSQGSQQILDFTLAIADNPFLLIQ